VRKIAAMALHAAAAGSLIVPAAVQAQDHAATSGALGVLGARDQLIAQFQKLPRPQLEAVFMRCSHESSRRLLDMNEGVMCAMAWDALLQRGFGGDVNALLAWWRARRDAPVR
jgi:hypothetical protein